MADDHSRRLPTDPEADDWLADEQPDLGLLRALADREELTDAVSRLADGLGLPLQADDPSVSLARELARELTLAGFTLHHCARSHPLYRLDGVCLLPVADGPGQTGCGGVAVSWTTHGLLSLDWDRWGEYHDARAAMNCVLAGVLDALGFQVQPFGEGGASLVTGQRSSDGRPGAGR